MIKRFNVQHQKWLVYRKRAHRRAPIRLLFHYSTTSWREGRDARTQTQRTTHHHFFIHSSDPVKHTTIVRHQIGRKQASKCVHRSVTATKHQECDAVLSANGRQRALQRTLVSRPRGAMFGHKVDESDVLRLQSVRIEVVAAPLGVHVHGTQCSPGRSESWVLHTMAAGYVSTMIYSRESLATTSYVRHISDSRCDISSVCIVVVVSGRR